MISIDSFGKNSGLLTWVSLVLNCTCSYEGEFVHGKFQGFGIYTRSDRMVYEGQFKDGKPDGQGIIMLE